MKVENYIVISDKISHKRVQNFTVNGEVYIPLDIPVPVILKGTGCVGIGIVTELVITSAATTITFNYEPNIDKGSKIAYYNLYRNQVSQKTNSEDPYENSSDVVIPGAITSISTKGTKNKSTYHWSENTRDNSSNSSLLDDYLDY